MKRWIVPWLPLLMLAGGCETDRQPAFVEPWDTLPRLEGIALDYAKAHQIDFDFSNAHPEAGTKEVTDVAYLYYYHAKDQPYYRFKIDHDGQVLQAGLMVPAAIDRRPGQLLAGIKPPGPVGNGTNAVANTNAPAPVTQPAPAPAQVVQATVETQPATAPSAAARPAPGTNGSEVPKRAPHPPAAQEQQFAEYNCAIAIPNGYRLRDKKASDLTNGVAMMAIFDNVLAGSMFMIVVGHADHYQPIDDNVVSNFEQEYNSPGGSEVVSGKFITVAGVKAYERVGWETTGKKRMATLAYVLRADGKIYVVEGKGKRDLIDYPEIRTTLDSFRFLRPPATEAAAPSKLGASLRSGLAAVHITRRVGIVIGAVLAGIVVVGVLLSRLGRRGPP